MSTIFHWHTLNVMMKNVGLFELLLLLLLWFPALVFVKWYTDKFWVYLQFFYLRHWIWFRRAQVYLSFTKRCLWNGTRMNFKYICNNSTSDIESDLEERTYIWILRRGGVKGEGIHLFNFFHFPLSFVLILIWMQMKLWESKYM